MTVQRKFDIQDQRIDLVRFPDAEIEPAAGEPPAPPTHYARVKQAVTLRRVLLCLPTIIAVFYFFILAASRYESVSTFVVRRPSAAAVSEIANLVQGTGIVSSADDAYIVSDYMLSRDAMHDLITHDGLLDMMARSGWDPVWAPPGTFLRSNEERLYRHYLAFVAVSFDSTTGISTLRVQAFDAHDAQKIATALLSHSEALLNRLNERAQSDAIASALQQVDISKQEAREVQQQITDFRNRESVIDPTLQSNVVLQTEAGLEVQMAEANAQLSELLKSSPESPQISNLRLRITALEDQIEKQRAQFGGKATSLAPLIAEYERLSLEREFAARAFISALNSLETARIDAQRRNAYLEQVARPSLPDTARYPYRVIWVLTIGAANFVFYWILRHLLRNALAHAQE